MSFYRWKQFPGRVIPDEDICPVVPELVAEVWRPDNTRAELERKLRDYFQAGLRMMWVVHPHTRTAEVYRKADEGARVGRNGSLDGEDVLPGFSLPLSDLFECLGRRRTNTVTE